MLDSSLSIIVPAYNEEARLGYSLLRILDYITDYIPSAELIVVDDGSLDSTMEVAERVCAEFPRIQTKVLGYDKNRGKGYAVRKGLLKASGEIAIFTDADLSTPISELPKLVEPIENRAYHVTFGSRALDRTLIETHQPWQREQGGRVINLMIRKMTGLPFSDTQCGFKAFDMKKFRPLLDVMTVNRFGFDVEFLFVAKYRGLRLKEIPVRWNNVEGSKVSAVRDTRRMFSELRQIQRNARRGIYDKKPETQHNTK
ncbi:MAG: glycosyltransferase family 2 protein [Acidobacteria bacterium]|jgi:dolichyl-phosphate beta-glucosyltransferase|nr:glycosyltransferase family 2 protein [Acidobacteriota bacterium]